MWLNGSLIFSLGLLVTISAESAAQGQGIVPTTKADCGLPPPLVCPPPPPPGPQTVEQLDQLVKGIDVSIGSIASASTTSSGKYSPGAAAGINAYANDLKGYRNLIVAYRDKMNPNEGGTMVAGPHQ